MKYKNMNGYKKSIIITVAFLLITFSGGCGYHLGSIMHPQVKSIAIAPLKNDTLEPNVSALMRGMLSEQFMVDGSLKVRSQHSADCVLYGRVIEVRTTETAEDSKNNDITYRAAQWGLQVRFEFEVIIPGNTQPLINKRVITGTARFDVTTDQHIARRRGIQQACLYAAEQVVQYTTEAW